MQGSGMTTQVVDDANPIIARLNKPKVYTQKRIGNLTMAMQQISTFQALSAGSSRNRNICHSNEIFGLYPGRRCVYGRFCRFWGRNSQSVCKDVLDFCLVPLPDLSVNCCWFSPENKDDEISNIRNNEVQDGRIYHVLQKSICCSDSIFNIANNKRND